MSSGSDLRRRAVAVVVAAIVVAVAAFALYRHDDDAAREVTFIRAPVDPELEHEQSRRAAGSDVLRVCADPNNLPFSNVRGEGFENRLAEVIAADLGQRVTYTWWPQRRGFVRNTVGAGKCDVVMGVPARFELLETTRPYYRSTYVFVTRKADRLDIRSLDDARLRSVLVGLHVIGDDYANVPPAQALASRGIVDNVRGYSIYGDYSQPDPPRVLIDALAAGDIDVAIAWGPLAGYFARRAPIPLVVMPIDSGDPFAPMNFPIAVGVRHGDDALKARIEQALVQHRGEIDALLEIYDVPRVDEHGARLGRLETQE